MQCVSYKQICYQAVNTKVMGLLVLISVFISSYCIGIFFSLYSSRLRPQLWLLHSAGKLLLLAGSLHRRSCLPPRLPPLATINGRATESPWVSPCWDTRGDGESQGEHSLPGSSPDSLLGAGPTGSSWLKKQARSHQDGEKARILREDNRSPQVLLNGEGAATSG